MREEKQALAQAVILAAPSREESLAQARRLAAAAVCLNPDEAPCGRCRACRKVGGGIHPDVIVIGRQTDDKGRLRREITVDQIRGIIADAVILPNEAERKVYILDEADKMNQQAQNAALKLLEEPPAGVVLLLCVSNPELLLPTVRSRCALVGAGTEETAPDAESAELAEGYLRAAAKRDRAALLRWCSAQEGLDTRQAAAFAEAACLRLTDALCGRASACGLSARELMELERLLQRCRDALRVNVGVKHIFGLLAVKVPTGGGNRGNDLDGSHQHKV